VALVWKCMYNTAFNISLLSAMFLTFITVVIFTGIASCGFAFISLTLLVELIHRLILNIP